MASALQSRTLRSAAILLVACLITLAAVAWFPARVAAAWLLAFGLPGALAARLLLGPARETEFHVERAAAGVALGMAIAAPLMLALAYLPGGISFGLLLTAFTGLTLLLGIANLWVQRAPKSAERVTTDRALLAALGAVLALGLLLRLVWLGYSEFQGDEARVLLRAGEVLLGYENVPSIHQKPPGEILIVAAMYGLVGTIDETMARLPFALASLAALAGTLLLGRRLVGKTAGVVAALILAMDGYLVAFGRIVQYQSLIFLCSVTLLLLLAGAVQAQRRAQSAGLPAPPLAGRLWGVALVGAGGLLFHYEMAAILLPAAWLIWRLTREGVAWRTLLRAIALPLLAGAALVLLFVVPFVRHPEFARTAAYVGDARLGGSPPYNSLRDVLQRSMLYSGGAFVALQALAMAVGAALLVRRTCGWVGALLAGLLLAGTAALALAQPAWSTIAGRDMSAVPLALALVGVTLLPRLLPGERTVWLWFAPLAALELTLVAVPHSHVYTFFIPLALVAGATLQTLDAEISRPAIRSVARGIAVVTLIYLAAWPWLMFADAPSERLRRWDEAQPVAFWYPFANPPPLAIFGFPLRNGWKAAGMMWTDGGLPGGYETNARAEVADWYTRGIETCPAPAPNFFLTQTVEPNDDAELATLAENLGQSYALLGQVLVSDTPRMSIFGSREGGPDGFASPILEEAVTPFRQATGTLITGRRGRIPVPQAAMPLDVRFDAGLRLAGVTLPHTSVAPGESLDLTLEWEALRPVGAEYTVFLHVVDPATNAKVGQRDSLPVCGRALTWHWSAGDRIADTHRVEIAADAAPGVYRLYAGLYTLSDGQRLLTRNPDGSPAADYVDLGEIVVE